MTATYRVWCLSWEEDDEEDGMDVVAVDLLTTPYKPATRRRGPIQVYRGIDAEDAAEAYADFVHSHREGNECTWPLVFRVRCPDGIEQDFSVTRDFEPTFRAAPVRQQGGRHGS